MPDLRETVAAELGKHGPRSVAYLKGWEARCSGCEWVGVGFVRSVSEVTDLHREHVADSLTALLETELREARAGAWDDAAQKMAQAYEHGGRYGSPSNPFRAVVR